MSDLLFMHHKISFCYTNVENDSALAVTLIHGDKVPEEPMCEAKMDPETAAGSDRIDAKSPISSTTIANDGGGGEGKVTTTMTTTSPVVVMKGPLTPFSQDDEMSSDDLISVGGSPSPSVTTSPDTFSRTHPDDGCEEEYFKPLKKLRMLKVIKSNFFAIYLEISSRTKILIIAKDEPVKSLNDGKDMMTIEIRIRPKE